MAQRDRPRLQAGLAVTRDQRFLNAGLDALGAAARLPGRQALTLGGLARDAQPFGPVPAHGALDFLAAGETDQGRDGLDLEMERALELAVVTPPRARRTGRLGRPG